jgi:hypothetical protein
MGVDIRQLQAHNRYMNRNPVKRALITVAVILTAAASTFGVTHEAHHAAPVHSVTGRTQTLSDFPIPSK